MRFLGQTKFGFHNDYPNDAEAHVHDDSDAVQHEQQKHIRHDGAPVPRNACPFTCDMTLNHFCQTFKGVLERDAQPEGFGFESLFDENYPASERLVYGRGGKKEIEVPLVSVLWKPRARLWCQAASLLAIYETEGMF